jgi:hypothetical protein
MRNPGGYAVVVSPEQAKINLDRFRCETITAGTFEADTFTCCHCNRVMHVKPRAPMDEFGSMCRNCMKMVCPKCADGPCVPFEKKLEAMERRSRALRSYGF